MADINRTLKPGERITVRVKSPTGKYISLPLVEVTGDRVIISPAGTTPTPTGPTFYLAPNGSDASNGSITAPWRTFTHASTLLNPGDTLYVRGGLYSKLPGGYYSWNARASGVSGNPIRIAAYPGETPVFDGGWTVGQALMFRPTSWLVIDGLTFTHYDTPGAGEGVIELRQGSHHITIQNCTFDNNGGTLWQDHAIYLNGSSSTVPVADVSILNNRFLNNTKGGGVHEYHDPGSLRTLVSGNTFDGNYWGVIMAATVDYPTITGNTFTNVLQSAIEFSAQVTNYTVTGNSPSNTIVWRP